MPTPTASEIIERVKARYAGCRTYEDTGTETMVIAPTKGPKRRSTFRSTFRTAFVRRTGFLFEQRDVLGPLRERDHGALWKNASGVSVWWKGRRSSNPAPSSLREAFVELNGHVATSDEVPRILMTRLGMRFPLPRGEGLTRLADSTLGRSPCYVFEVSKANERTRVWIERDSLLLRKLVVRSVKSDERRLREAEVLRAKLGRMQKHDVRRPFHAEVLGFLTMPLPAWVTNSVTVTTTTWDPRMDHAIDPKVFEFAPPR